MGSEGGSRKSKRFSEQKIPGIFLFRYAQAPMKTVLQLAKTLLRNRRVLLNVSSIPEDALLHPHESAVPALLDLAEYHILSVDHDLIEHHTV
jgi:hypothetical protein